MTRLSLPSVQLFSIQMTCPSGPRARQCMIDRGHLVMHDPRIGLVEVDALLDDPLPIRAERNAGLVEQAGSRRSRVSTSSTS
jgi:hypothetical protein